MHIISSPLNGCSREIIRGTKAAQLLRNRRSLETKALGHASVSWEWILPFPLTKFDRTIIIKFGKSGEPIDAADMDFTPIHIHHCFRFGSLLLNRE
jgi:hypothetical protein